MLLEPQHTGGHERHAYILDYGNGGHGQFNQHAQARAGYAFFV